MRTLVSPTYVVWYKKSETRHIEVFATFEMGYPFIQSVLVQALKQLWDSNDDFKCCYDSVSYVCQKPFRLIK